MHVRNRRFVRHTWKILCTSLAAACASLLQQKGRAARGRTLSWAGSKAATKSTGSLNRTESARRYCENELDNTNIDNLQYCWQCQTRVINRCFARHTLEDTSASLPALCASLLQQEARHGKSPRNRQAALGAQRPALSLFNDSESVLPSRCGCRRKPPLRRCGCRREPPLSRSRTLR